MHDVCVIGLGYVGLPIAALWASTGLKVHGVDIDQAKLNDLRSGNNIHEERNVAELVRSASSQALLSFGDKPENAEFFVVAVPTPVLSSKSADIGLVFEAINSIGRENIEGKIVIVESTCSPGSAQTIERLFRSKGWSFDVVMAPERVLPGDTLREIKDNDRILGGDELPGEQVAKLYRRVVDGKILKVSSTEAELAKIFENTFRDVNIALANEMSAICESFGANFSHVREVANCHPRVSIHQDGIGVGGHCIPVDPNFLVDGTNNTTLISAARAVNEAQPKKVASRINTRCFENGITELDVYGLTYKPNVADFRDSPALIVVDILEHRYAIKCNLFDIQEHQQKNISYRKNITPGRAHVVLVGQDPFLQVEDGCLFHVSSDHALGG